MEKATKFIFKVFVLLLAVGVLTLVWSFFFDRGGSEIGLKPSLPRSVRKIS